MSTSATINIVKTRLRSYISWPVYVTGFLYLLFSALAFIFGLKESFIYLKIVIVFSVSLLIFFPRLYPFLFGLLVPTYFELKSYSGAVYDKDIMVPFACVMIILMFISITLRKIVTKDRSSSLLTPVIPTACLFLFVLISLIWFIFSPNEFLAIRQIIQIMAFSAAFFIGKVYSKDVVRSFSLLLLGLFFGLFAFTLPWSVGELFHGGTKMLKTLSLTRNQLGAASISVESGMTLIIFGFAYALSSSNLPPRIKRFSLWLVAIPACLATSAYLSRAAIMLMPVCVIITLFIAGRKRSAIMGGIAFCLLALVIFIIIPEWGNSIERRVANISAAGKYRESIRLIALKIGLAHPIFGVGPGQFRLYSGGVWHAHNDSLNIFAEQGVMALALYLIFLVYSGLSALKLFFQKDPLHKSIGGSLIVVIVAYLGYSQIEPLYINPGGLLFTFLIGLGTALATRRETHVTQP